MLSSHVTVRAKRFERDAEPGPEAVGFDRLLRYFLGLGTWGFGAHDSGVSQASHPAIDGAGHLWVIDVDPATHHSVIKILEPA